MGKIDLKRCLILITSSYPYQTQESFLESEIPYIQNHFDKIITLAIDLGKGAKKMRATPENADCYNVAATGKTVSRYLSISIISIKPVLTIYSDLPDTPRASAITRLWLP